MRHYQIFIYTIVVFILVTGCSTSAGQNTNASAANAPAKASQATNRGASPALTAGPATVITQQPTTQVNAPNTLVSTATAVLPAAPIASATAATQAATPVAPTVTTRPALGPEDWKNLPIVPEISDTVRDIYKIGQTMGNNPQAFSKIGDCGSTPAWFLGDFDRGPAYYRLGEYEALQGVIDYYQGSFERTSLAARSGFNASALWVPLWADRTYCNGNEAPLVCEYRIHRPAIAFIMLGTNDVWKPEEFEPQMRKIIEYSIGNGIIPVLSTKADNQERDHRINTTIARLAMEYDIPLWNYWAAVNNLPNGGLQEDSAHLTWGRNFFDDPEAMQKAWPVRNLTALQVLDAIWQKVR